MEQLRELERQEAAQLELLDQLKHDRDGLMKEFDEENDLKSKIIVDGIKKIAVLGVIKYH